MGLLNKFFSNVANPKGLCGRLLLNGMNTGHAKLTNWGLDFIEFKPEWTMLDIGCGGGATLARLVSRSENCKAYGIDISDESVEKSKKVNRDNLGKSVFVTKGNVEKLPFEDCKFDLVSAVETVYFWPDLKADFREVARVIKPGGCFIIILESVDVNNKWQKMVDGMKTPSEDIISEALSSALFSKIDIKRKGEYATFIATK